MAGRGIVINFLSNVREFVRGTDDAERALDDVADSLDDAARDGDQATQKLERSFRDLTRVADRETKQLGDAVGDNVTKGTRRAEEGLDDFKSEAKQSGAEGAASFSGEWDDVGDFIQETVANGLSGFGPLGLAAGIAGAAGIGFLTAEITKQNDKAEELKDTLVSAYQEAGAAGRDYLDTAQIIALANDIIFDEERRSAAIEDARTLGVEVLDVIRAQAGDMEALQRVIEGATQAEQDRLDLMLNDTAGKAASLSIEVQAIRDVADEYRDLAEQNEENSQRAREAAELRTTLEQEQRDEIARTRRTDQERWEAAARRFGVDLTPATVGLNVDIARAEAAVNRWLRNPRNLRVNIEARDFAGRRVV